MSANLTLGPSALLLIRESQLARFRNIDVGPNARLLVLPDALPENWAALLAKEVGASGQAGGQRSEAGEEKASP